MIETFIISIPHDLTYQDLKQQILFPQDVHGVSCWAFKTPLIIYSEDLTQKHQFVDGIVKVATVQNVCLQEKWKYFVMTKSDGRRVYCTSYVFYEKNTLRYQQTSIFNMTGKSIILTQFYVPKCLVLMSSKPYFKLQTNLVKIHRQLRHRNPFIAQFILPNSLRQYENQLRVKQQNYNGSHSQRFRSNLTQSNVTIYNQKQGRNNNIYVPNEIIWKYYIQCCNSLSYGQKIYVCSLNKMEILHLYSIPQSIYRFNYFFHLPLSTGNLMTVLSAILQQKQILFVSNNQNSNLMLMQTLLQMIAPLKWDYMYVPNLPTTMLQAAEECFMPYLVGIHSKHLDKITLRGRVVVHVDNDQVQTDEPIVELPRPLKTMILLQNRNAQSLQYLDWEKQMRLKSIMMISTLLSQFWVYQQNHYVDSDYQFYSYFFKQSALFQTYNENIYKQANIQTNQLTWLTFQQKIKLIQYRFAIQLRSAVCPTICENSKEFLKYYYHNYYAQDRNKNKTMKQSLMVQSKRNSGDSSKIIISSLATEGSFQQSRIIRQIRGKKSAFHKKGIQFVSTIKA